MSHSLQKQPEKSRRGIQSIEIGGQLLTALVEEAWVTGKKTRGLSGCGRAAAILLHPKTACTTCRLSGRFPSRHGRRKVRLRRGSGKAECAACRKGDNSLYWQRKRRRIEVRPGVSAHGCPFRWGPVLTWIKAQICRCFSMAFGNR